MPPKSKRKLAYSSRSSGIKDSARIVARGSQKVRQRLSVKTTGTEKPAPMKGKK